MHGREQKGSEKSRGQRRHSAFQTGIDKTAEYGFLCHRGNEDDGGPENERISTHKIRGVLLIGICPVPWVWNRLQRQREQKLKGGSKEKDGQDFVVFYFPGVISEKKLRPWSRRISQYKKSVVIPEINMIVGENPARRFKV